MSEDLLKSVQTLLNVGRGDKKRLTEILNTIKEQDPLYLSDYKYVHDLISEMQIVKQETIEPKQKIKSKDKKSKKDISEEQKQSHQQSGSDSSLAILKTRLANGEITIEEFREIKKALTGA